MPFVIIKTNTEHSLVYAKSFFFLQGFSFIQLSEKMPSTLKF